MSTTPTRSPAVPSPTDPCAGDRLTSAGQPTQSLQDLAGSQFSRADQPATGTEQATLELSGPALRFLRDALVIGLADHPWVNDPHWPSIKLELERLEAFLERPREAGPLPRLSLSEYIRAHNATASVDEFAAAVQALTTCAAVRIHAAQTAAAGKTGGIASARFEALLSAEFWSSVAFNLDMLHKRFLEELERRDESARLRAQVARQEVTR